MVCVFPAEGIRVRLLIFFKSEGTTPVEPEKDQWKQEPGDDAQIKAFAEGYGVKFDMFSKIEVNGDGAHPLWKWLKEQPKGRGTLGNAIKWNFTKFLINREGQVVKRYSPMEDPYVIEKDLPAYL